MTRCDTAVALTSTPGPHHPVGDAAVPGGVVRRADSVYVSADPAAIAKRMMADADEFANRCLIRVGLHEFTVDLQVNPVLNQ